MRVVTWNMDYWKHRSVHEAAWLWLLDELAPDIALLQECASPAWVSKTHQVIWDPAYPGGGQTWGSATVIQGLPTERTTIEPLTDWFGRLPSTVDSTGQRATIFRPEGWCAIADVECPDGTPALVVGVHNPFTPIERERLRGVDVSDMKLKLNPDVWLLDVLLYFLKDKLDQRVILGGDFNSSRLLDTPERPRGNNELFDRMADQGFVSWHRRFHDEDERTFFGKGNHQLDYLYSDGDLAQRLTSCEVAAYERVERFSDHAPLVAELQF